MSDDTHTGVNERLIYHLFADHGVESEALAAYGSVHRYTIDPRENPVNARIIQMDLMEEMPPEGADLVLLHPKCAKWCDMPNVDPDDHENQIPRAREIARTVADNYIIENKPRAPLRDPVFLDGKMFGLPIQYERAFETSFPVETPPRQLSIETEVSPYFFSDRTHEWWKAVKGYSTHHPKQHLAKNALPAAYVHCLARSWLKAINDRDAKQAQDNNSPAPRDPPPDQSRLSHVTDGGTTDIANTGSDREGRP